MPHNDNEPSTENVVYLNIRTSEDIPPNRVLENAPKTLTTVFVLGYDEDGEIYAASSSASAEELLFLLERFKFSLLSGEYR